MNSSKSGSLIFDRNRSRYYKVLPSHNNPDSFLTSTVIDDNDVNAFADRVNLSKPSILNQLYGRELLPSWKHPAFLPFVFRKLRSSSVKTVKSCFPLGSIEGIIPLTDSSTAVISRLNSEYEVEIRFLEHFRKGNDVLCRELHPSTSHYGTIISPCFANSPNRLIFAVVSGLAELSSALIFHDIEHGYHEV